MSALRLAASTLVATVAGTSAQLPMNPGMGKNQMDGTVEFSSRSGLPGTMAGRVATHFPVGRWAGLKQVTSFVFRVQDQDGSTPEAGVFEVRLQDPTTGLPDWPANPGLPLLALPIPIVNDVLGVSAWECTITPVVPLPLPGDAPFYLVWQLPTCPAWPADGLSVHLGTGVPHPCGQPGFPACCGANGLGGWEQARSGITQNLCVVDTAAGGIAFAPLDPVHFHWLRFDRPVLQTLASNPTWFCPLNEPSAGHAALDPDVADTGRQGRNDDLGWRVLAGPGYAGGVAFVYISAQVLSTPYVVPGMGDIWIDPRDSLFYPSLIQGPIRLGADGVGQHFWRLGPPGNPTRLLLNAVCMFHHQALVIDPAGQQPVFTNLDTFRFEMPGGRWGSVIASQPYTVSLNGMGNLRVGNDGPGDLDVTFWAGDPGLGGVLLPGALLVHERTTNCTETSQFGGRVPVGATHARVSTRNANTWNWTHFYYSTIP